MSEPKHSHITTYEELTDGSWRRKTIVYHEKLASIKEERVEHIITTHSTLVADIIKCLEPISGAKTRDLKIEIHSDEYKNPKMITRTYTTYKEDFKKK